MGTTESESPAATQETRRQREKGKYVVMREITSLDELTAILEAGDRKVYAVVEDAVEARSSDAAIRDTVERTAKATDAPTGRYVAPPQSSFRPVRVRQVVQLSTEPDE